MGTKLLRRTSAVQFIVLLLAISLTTSDASCLGRPKKDIDEPCPSSKGPNLRPHTPSHAHSAPVNIAEPSSPKDKPPELGRAFTGKSYKRYNFQSDDIEKEMQDIMNYRGRVASDARSITSASSSIRSKASSIVSRVSSLSKKVTRPFLNRKASSPIGLRPSRSSNLRPISLRQSSSSASSATKSDADANTPKKRNLLQKMKKKIAAFLIRKSTPIDDINEQSLRTSLGGLPIDSVGRKLEDEELRPFASMRRGELSSTSKDKSDNTADDSVSSERIPSKKFAAALARPKLDGIFDRRDEATSPPGAHSAPVISPIKNLVPPLLYENISAVMAPRNLGSRQQRRL